jgi:hypothetical protein
VNGIERHHLLTTKPEIVEETKESEIADALSVRPARNGCEQPPDCMKARSASVPKRSRALVPHCQFSRDNAERIRELHERAERSKPPIHGGGLKTSPEEVRTVTERGDVSLKLPVSEELFRCPLDRGSGNERSKIGQVVAIRSQSPFIAT